MNTKVCQSYAMPLTSDDLFGKNADGSKNEDYCKYCFDNGVFTTDTTMEEMIAMCAPHVVKSNPDMSEEEAVIMLRQYLPTLKRWQ